MMEAGWHFLATFILIHGGWAGTWQWEQVAPLLRNKNHTVFVPALTGLGEKQHLAAPDVDVTSHINDTAAVMEKNDVTGGVLVGFSYGGMVATGAADRLRNRIRTLIYLDAFFPLPGQSLFDIFGEKVSKSLLAVTNTFGKGWLLPFFDTYDSRLTDQPKQTGTEKLYYPADMFRLFRTVYIECTAKPESWTFTSILQGIAAGRRRAGWDVREFPSGHFPMNSHPEALAELLDAVSREAGSLPGQR